MVGAEIVAVVVQHRIIVDLPAVSTHGDAAAAVPNDVVADNVIVGVLVRAAHDGKAAFIPAANGAVVAALDPPNVITFDDPKLRALQIDSIFVVVIDVIGVDNDAPIVGGCVVDARLARQRLNAVLNIAAEDFIE